MTQQTPSTTQLAIKVGLTPVTLSFMQFKHELCKDSVQLSLPTESKPVLY